MFDSVLYDTYVHTPLYVLLIDREYVASCNGMKVAWVPYIYVFGNEQTKWNTESIFGIYEDSTAVSFMSHSGDILHTKRSNIQFLLMNTEYLIRSKIKQQRNY
jgi:hypothetical protein